MECNNCGNEDHRSERCHLASDNFYERGYRAGVEAAAKVADSHAGLPGYGRGRPGLPPRFTQAVAIADGILALLKR